MVGLNGNVFAKDIYTTTTTINGVTVNWEYELNEANKIENLKCTNSTDLNGNITIPSILENVKDISIYSFHKHNEDLTIYCYENSVAAKYAIDNKIKYVYLTKPTTGGNTDKKEEQNQQQGSSAIQNSNKKPEKKDDTTIATGKIPQTGISMTILFVIISISIVSIIFYKKYNDYKDIK